MGVGVDLPTLLPVKRATTLGALLVALNKPGKRLRAQDLSSEDLGKAQKEAFLGTVILKCDYHSLQKLALELSQRL